MMALLVTIILVTSLIFIMKARDTDDSVIFIAVLFLILVSIPQIIRGFQ